jgi:predicted nucleic acid-binding protein
MSVLLDTNVLSEILRSAPDPAVLAWFATQRDDDLFVSAVTQAEMFLGARLLPEGQRRHRLQDALRGLFEAESANPVLPFDGPAVNHYVEVVATRRSAGRPISHFDAQTAAIALQNDLGLATRNIRDFEGCGVRLVNPWTGH